MSMQHEPRAQHTPDGRRAPGVVLDAHRRVPARALAVSLALLGGCPSPGETTTSATNTTGEGPTTGESAALPTTTAAASASEPNSTSSGSTGAVSVTGTVGESTDATTDGASVGDTTSGGDGTGMTAGGTTGGGTTGTTGGDTTGTTGGGTTGGDTTGGDTTGGDTTGGDTTGGGGAQLPFFPPCDALAIGEPITLADLSPPADRKTPATLAYDGHDLVVVRDDRDPMFNKCETQFERRDPTTGALLGPGVRSPALGLCGWNGALGYDPSSNTYLFLSQTIVPTLGLTAFDAKGNKLWQAGQWALCNSLAQSMDVQSRGGEWVVMGETFHCGFNGDRFTSVQVWSVDGQQKFWLQTAKETAAAGGAACDLPACDRVLTLRFGLEGQEGGTWAQMGDLVAGKLDAKKTKLNGSAFGGWDANAAVWNGTDWLILRIEDTGPSHKGHIGRWDENLGWTTPDQTFSSGETPTEIELLWTGHDYVGAYAEFPDDNTQLPSDWFTFDIYLLLIGADGKLKKHQIFERPQGYGGYAPQLVALPGAIGLSWVRVTKNPNNTLSYTRHLARITCAG